LGRRKKPRGTEDSRDSSIKKKNDRPQAPRGRGEVKKRGVLNREASLFTTAQPKKKTPKKKKKKKRGVFEGGEGGGFQPQKTHGTEKKSRAKKFNVKRGRDEWHYRGGTGLEKRGGGGEEPPG